MSINLGDAVLHFFGDSSGLEQSFKTVESQANASMGGATEAIKGTSAAVDDMSKSMAIGQQGAVELGDVTNLAGEKSRESMYQARGELSLLGEEFGVKLPRHVQAFVAELPGVGVALSAAFSATAILFLIEAVIKIVEKIREMANAGKEIEEAWAKVDKAQDTLFNHLEDNLLKAQSRTAELTGNHLEALRLKLQLINNQSLEQLDKELERLGQEADAAFQKMDRNWFEKLLIGFQDSDEAKNKLKEIGTEVDKALSARTPEAFDNALTKVNAALTQADAKIKQLAEQQKEFQEEAAKAGDPLMNSQGVDPRTVESWQKLSKVLQGYKTDIEEAHKVEQEQAKDAGIQDHNREAAEAVSKANLALAAQIAAIEKWKSEQQAAFAAGKTDAAAWAVAQVQATDAAEIAHETYLQKVVTIYKAAGESQKAQTAQQELANFQTTNAAKETEVLAGAMEKHRAATQKVVAEYQRLIDAGIAKDFAATTKATDQLTKADEELTKAQTKLAEVNITQNFRNQEQAISQLAQFHLITEQQKAQKLFVLYKQEEDQALAVLRDQGAKEQSVIKATEAQITQAQAAGDNVRVLELKASLAKETAAYTQTQTQIVTTKDKFDKQLLALDKTRYGQALSLAIASGNQLLAQELKDNHASLLAAQAKLAEAKARGQNTAAIDKEVQELKKLDQQLQSDATKVKGVSGAMVELKATLVAAATEEIGAFSSATEAMITGQQSFGQAMEAATFKMLGNMAKKWAEYYMALGIGNAASMDWGAAAGDFAAAAAFEALSGVLTGLGANASKSGAGASKSGPTTINTTGTAATNTPAASPTQTVNIPHLASGGLVTAPTLVMLGESNRPEAVLPLHDAAAMNMLGEAFARHMSENGSSGSGGLVINNNFKGSLISHNQLIKTMSRQVETGRARFTASNAHKTTRRA